jgi:integrase
MQGHLEKRGKDSWTIVIDKGRNPITNKRERIKKAVKGTKPEVQKVMNEMLHKLQTGTYIETHNLTVAEYFNHWIETYCTPNLAPKTLHSYRSEISNHIIPNLGQIPLEKLSPLHLQSYYSQLLTSGRRDGNGGLSARTILYHHRIIREALKHAFRWQLVSRNVADAVEPPRFKKKEMFVMSREEVLTFLEAIEEHRDYAIIYTAIYTGMRQGELLGLTWKNVDLKHKVLNVRQQLQYQPGNGYVFKEPKTPRSKRQIPLTPGMVDVFKEIRKLQAQDKLLLGVKKDGNEEDAADQSKYSDNQTATEIHSPEDDASDKKKKYEDNDLVFCLENGKPLDGTNLTKRFKALAKKHGHPEMRFHDLRHTCATLLLAAGVDPKKVQDILGHESFNTTMDVYGHVLPSMQREAMDKLNAFMGQ